MGDKEFGVAEGNRGGDDGSPKDVSGPAAAPPPIVVDQKVVSSLIRPVQRVIHINVECVECHGIGRTCHSPFRGAGDRLSRCPIDWTSNGPKRIEIGHCSKASDPETGLIAARRTGSPYRELALEDPNERVRIVRRAESCDVEKIAAYLQ